MSNLRLGWIGLGIMGRPMAGNLLRAGFSVTAFNRTKSRMDGLLRAGATAAASPRAVAVASNVVVVMVADTPDVEEVLFGREPRASGKKGLDPGE